MTTMLSPGTRHPATCSFGACSTKEGSSSGSSQVCDFQSKNSCLAAAEKPGQVLVFLLPTQEGKTAAGVESRPRPPGANRAERSGWLECTAAGVKGGLPARLVPPARVREMWTPGWANFLSGNLLGCIHQSQVCSPGRLSRQKTWAWDKFIFEGCVSLLVAVQSLNRVWLLATPWTAARQAPLESAQFPELAQIHVHWLGDAIQPSHPLLSPSPPAFNLSQHQGLLKWVSSSHQVAKVLELQLEHQFFQWICRADLL